ncbi:MAG: hypothetical protein VX613_03045, partial [Candidatus Thermoplasmatota archaeon]|nr:hypothetical protein [Candidatus Thermoplasmatota archaeon]
MLIIELLEILGLCCGIYFSLIVFPWASILFFNKSSDLTIEIEEIEENETVEYSYIIDLGENRKVNPRISAKLMN